MKATLRWIIERVVRPCVLLVGGGLEAVFNFFFFENDVGRSIERETGLASEVERNLDFLFSEYSAVIMPIDRVEPANITTRHPRPFDWAFVIVALDDILLKFFRGSGDLSVWIASRRDSQNWGELPVVLHWLGWRKNLGSARAFSSLQEVAEVLRPCMQLLLDAYSAGKYAEIRQKVSETREREKGEARILSAELNRKLHGS
jgi:hypothetical protein